MSPDSTTPPGGGADATPRFTVDEAGFAQHLSRLGSTQSPHPFEQDLRLAFACAAGDPRALADFDANYLSQIHRTLGHLRQQPSFYDEVRQQLRVRLLVAGPRGPRLLDYSGSGPLAGFVRVAATRLALDLLEARQPHPEAQADAEDDFFANSVDPELMALRQRHLPQLREAFRAALGALTQDERTLLRFYLVDGLNLEKLAKLFGWSRATAGRRLVDCRRALLEGTRQRLRALSGAPDAEVGSLIRALRSQLDVSLRSALAREVKAR